MLTRRRQGRARLAIATVLGLLATLVVTVAAPPAGVVQAVPAPTSPLPSCVYDEDDNAGLGCAPGELGAVATGTFASDSSFVIDAGEIGFAPCADYVSTGCYYEVYSPSIVRCVYLYDNDPTDVRSCSGSFSTSGSVGTYSAQRQGSCRGELGSTYALGGPANGDPSTWWVNRGPVAARCEYYIDTVDIDRLAGPTFLLVSASVDECIEPGNGYGCDESWATLERHTRYAWIPVEGDLAPRASFDFEQVGNSGSIMFENTSIPFDEPTTYEWDFDDGSTSSAFSPSHTYAETGDYWVRLTMRGSSGETRTATQLVDLSAPDLIVSVFNPHADFGPDGTGNKYDVGDEFTVRVVASATDGFGNLDDVAPVEELLTLPEQFAWVDDPVAIEPRTFVPGDRVVYDVPVEAVAPGLGTIRSSWEGVDLFASPLGPWSGSFDAKVEGLKVTVELDPEAQDLDVDDLPLPVTATVTVENLTEVAMDQVRLQGPLDWGPLHADETLPDVNLEFVDPDAVAATFAATGTVDLGSLAPGADNAKTYEYELQATGRAHAEVEQLVSFTQGIESGNTLGTGELRLGGLLLEFDSRIVKPVGSQLLPAGESIQIEGTIKNRADFAIEIGPPPPKVEGNAGAVSVVFDPTGEGPDPSEVAVPGIRVLQPDEEVDFRVRINTQWSDPRTYGTERSGGTRAYVEFTPWGRYPDPDDVEAPIEYIYFETERMLTSEADLKYTIPIDDSVEIPEFDALDFSSGVFVGSVEGLGHAAVGIVTGVIETPYAVYNTMRAVYTFIEQVWASFTPEEHEAFKESVLYATYQFLTRSAEMAKQTYDEVRPQLDTMLTRAFTEIAEQWELGDYVGATRTYSRYTSELIGSILIPIALAKLAKAPQAVAAAQRAQAAIQAAAIPVLQTVRNTRLVKSLYTSLLALKSGLIIDPADVRRLFGITPDELGELQAIANVKKYLITVRSRHASSIDWIQDLKALVKPEALKIKSVNEMDIRLGYDTALIEGRQPLGALVFKKPEPLIRWDAGETGDIGGMVRQFVESKGFTPDTPDYESALQRTYQRMKEWREFEADYKKFDKEGLEVSYNYEGNQIPPDVRQSEFEVRGFDLQEVPGEPETYIVRMMDDEGFFRPVTGDIDAIAFTKADGSPLNAKEHADLLDEIKDNPKLAGQHGETATFDPPGSGLGGINIISKQFKPGEPALQVMPDTAGARIVRFNPDKSRWNDARDYNLHWDGGYVETSRRLATGAVRPFEVTVPAIVAADATEAFVLEASNDGSPNYGRCRVIQSDSDPNAVSVFGGEGGLFELLTDGSVQPSPLGEQCMSEGDPLDLVMRSADVLNGVLGGGGSFASAGTDGLSASEPTGSTEISLVDPAGFDVGDEVAIGVGTDRVEFRTVTSTDPIVVTPAVAHSHASGELVLVTGTSTLPLGGALFPLTPARVFETRAGEVTVDGEFEAVGRLVAGSVTPVQIAGRGGVSGDAAAVALNVTAIRPSGVGYVTLFPCGEDQPLTSSLNYAQGAVAGNSGIVKLNSAGELCVFTFADTDLVIDVNAWLAEVPSFASLTPARLAETRSGEVTVDGEAQELGRLDAGSVTEVQIAGRGGVDAGADAVALNVTAIRPDGVGYVTLYPCDEERPTTSSLNYSGGGAVGNSAVVSLSSDGSLCVFTFADTDLVLDVNAWLADDASFDPFVPARFFETRSGQETVDGVGNGGGRLDAGSVTPIQVAGRGDVPAGASAVALNVTAVRPDGVGYITLFPCDGDQPLTSSLNYSAGGAVGNSGVVKLAADGTVCAYTRAETDLVIDVNAAWN